MSSRFLVRGLISAVVAISLPAGAHAETIGVAWRTNLDAAKIEAAQTGRLLLIHFFTQSCAPCKVLDQNVLSQPHVGAAVEQDYVPVKVDADQSPALAHMFRIDRVPTEVVLTPQGNVVATLSTPDNPDAYVAQLQNLARHFRQTTPGANGAPSSPALNVAYANLPAVAGGAAAAVAPAGQDNPYTAAPMSGGVASPATGGTAGLAGAAPTMPGNAMTVNYRNPTPDSVATTGAAAGVAADAAALAAATTVPTNPSPGSPYPTTQAQVAAIKPAQPPLPANCPPVAFDGCCPVTLKTQNAWALGNTSFGVIHRGRTYLFVGEQQRQQFLADPDSFSPVFAGYDPVLLLDQQQSVPGSRKFGFRYGGSFYLFSSRETMAKFEASPHTYAAGVRQAMARVDGSIVRR